MNRKQSRVSILTYLVSIALLGVFAFVFDIPVLWAVGIFFVLLIIGLILARRQAPPGSNRLLLGLTLLAIAGGLVLNGVIAVRPEIPESTPDEVLSLPAAYDTIGLGPERFVVFYRDDGDTRLNIQFETVSTLEGHWAYEDAWVDAEQALRGTYDADPVERPQDWSDTIYTSDNNPSESVTPSFTVVLPLEAKHLYDEVDLSARMILTYPEETGNDEYQVRERRVRREFTLFVASPADRAIREQYDTWTRRTLFVSEGGLPILLGIAAVGAIFTLWGLVKIRASGGYGIILPSLLGKLGAVVSDTSLIPKNQVQGTLPKGVIIIGKIRPSSPAERASLLPGDIITEADGQPIDSHRAAKRVVERWKRGEDHTMTVLRGQQSLHIFVQM